MYDKQHYKKHKKTLALRNKKWRQSNREKVNKIARKWRKNNLQKVREYDHKYYHQKHKLDKEYMKKKRDYAKKYWEIPENKERRRKQHFRRYLRNLPLFARYRHAAEMRAVLKILTKELLPKNTDVAILYDKLVRAVEQDPILAKEKFPHGIPDAQNHKVEFKIGFDRIHRDQFVWDVLNGRVCKIRWFPSYDSLDDALRGKKHDGLFFKSYLNFVSWKYEGRQ